MGLFHGAFLDLTQRGRWMYAFRLPYITRGSRGRGCSKALRRSSPLLLMESWREGDGAGAAQVGFEHASGLDPRSTPQPFYKYFYRAGRRLKVEGPKLRAAKPPARPPGTPGSWKWNSRIRKWNYNHARCLRLEKLLHLSRAF